ncbi:DUF3035 domain-containing protein [Benzoatithermus flavus]|uniref:DUF3035 domain-containing protein n=1 Tax=Benzoatithermus flavus TaxID=3108223 RepID=A0ABU8XTI8_9PROT
MIRSERLAAVLTLMAIGLAGCGGGTVAESLGMGKRSPDEFQVVRRAPLVLPPDYNLRPPEPGAPPSQQQDTAAQAEALLIGRAAERRPAAPTAQSPGEQALVEQSPVRAEPNIREVLLAENQDLMNLDEGRFLFILNWQKKSRQPQEPVIDPVAEAKRLAAAGATGSVVTMRTGSRPLSQ